MGIIKFSFLECLTKILIFILYYFQTVLIQQVWRMFIYFSDFGKFFYNFLLQYPPKFYDN